MWGFILGTQDFCEKQRNWNMTSFWWWLIWVILWSFADSPCGPSCEQEVSQCARFAPHLFFSKLSGVRTSPSLLFSTVWELAQTVKKKHCRKLFAGRLPGGTISLEQKLILVPLFPAQLHQTKSYEFPVFSLSSFRCLLCYSSHKVDALL